MYPSGALHHPGQSRPCRIPLRFADKKLTRNRVESTVPAEKSSEKIVEYLLSSVLVLVLVLGNSYSALAQSEVTFLAPSPITEELEN